MEENDTVDPYATPKTPLEHKGSTVATEPPRQSGLGIASFVISLIGIAITLVLFGVAGYMEASTPGGMDEAAPETILVGLLLIAAGFLLLVGLGLGIGGLFQRNRRRLFAVLGLAFSGVMLLIGIGVMAIGMTME